MKISPIIILFALFLFAFSEADAQYRNTYKRHGSKLDIRAGLQGGLVFPKFVGDEFIIAYDSRALEVYPDVTYESLMGFTAGMYVDVRLSDGLFIQPEINFTQMGARMVRQVDIFNEEGGYIVTDSSFVGLGVSTIKIEKRLNYLTIPLLVKVPMGKGFNFTVGPQIGFKISENEGYGSVLISDSLLAGFLFIDPEAPSLFKDTELGAVIGLNYQMKNGFNFNLRFNKNFKNINKNEGLRLLTREPDNKSQAFIFTVAYTFLYDQRLKEDPTRRH